ncbi:MAG: DUF423 domain-containing protein [Isosphaeraceae bacterium]|nr:DUF423 domain-containing protein [Isosphaeraceae bacterium]
MSGSAWLRLAAVLGGLAVALGAFGAHGLKGKLEALQTTAIYHTAVQYHFYHALALLAVGLVALQGRSGPALVIAGWSFTVGVLIFSGTLYALALSGIKWLGAITPIGGVALIFGWVALAVAAGDVVKPAAGGAEI